MFKKIDLSRVVIVPREEYDRLKRAAEDRAPRIGFVGDTSTVRKGWKKYEKGGGPTDLTSDVIRYSMQGIATPPRVERPFVEQAPAPGAFLSADEDRELVAMGREMMREHMADNTTSLIGAIACDNEIRMEDGNWPNAFVPTATVSEHLTDAARALLRRVRDERKQAANG